MKSIKRRSVVFGIIFALIIGGGLFYHTFLSQAQVPDAPAVATMKGVGYGDCFAYESLDVTDTAVALTAGTYTTDVKKAFITLETAQIRWRIDGTDPIISEGHILETTQTLTLNGYSQIARFRAIRTGSSGKIRVSYLK